MQAEATKTTVTKKTSFFPAYKKYLSQLIDQLKTFLKSDIQDEKMPIIPSFLSGSAMQEYKILPLELDFENSPTQRANTGYFKHRQAVIATHSPPQDNVPEKVFCSSAIFALSDAERVPKRLHSNIIAVTGAASTGKTSLLKGFLAENTLPFLFDYVFYLPFLYLDLQSVTNLLQFLVPTLPHQWICDEFDCMNVLQELDKSDKVLIDGYCPSQPGVSDQQAESYVYTSTVAKGGSSSSSSKEIATEIPVDLKSNTGEIFLESILSRKILTRAKVIVTTNTHCFLNLEKRLRNYPRFEILGLNDESRKQMCQNICGKNSTQILDFIQFYPLLHKICDNPETCSAVIYVVNQIFSKQINGTEFAFGLSLTRVAIATYSLLLQNKNVVLESHILKDLAVSAWGQVQNGLLVDLAETELSNDCHFDAVSPLSIETVIEEENVVKSRNVEILAAMNSAFYTDLDEFEKFLETGFQDSGKNTFRFVAMHACGLMNDPITFSCLKKLQPSLEIPPEKIKLLDDKMEKQLQRSDNSFATLMFLCTLSQSKSDEELAAECAARFKDVVEVNGDIYPTDVAGLWYALLRRKESLLFRVGSAKANFVRNQSKSQFVMAMLKLPKIKVTLA